MLPLNNLAFRILRLVLVFRVRSNFNWSFTWSSFKFHFKGFVHTFRLCKFIKNFIERVVTLLILISSLLLRWRTAWFLWANKSHSGGRTRNKFSFMLCHWYLILAYLGTLVRAKSKAFPFLPKNSCFISSFLPFWTFLPQLTSRITFRFHFSHCCVHQVLIKQTFIYNQRLFFILFSIILNHTFWHSSLFFSFLFFNETVICIVSF